MIPTRNTLSLRQSQRLALLCLFAAVLNSCQLGGVGNSAELESRLSLSLPMQCVADIRAFRSAVERDDVVNASTPPLTFMPLLHSDRFHYALSQSIETEAEIGAWISLLGEKGIQSRMSENSNLSSPWSASRLEALADCATSFAEDVAHAEAREEVLALVRQSRFQDNYRKGPQVLGALSILRPFLKSRIVSEHAEERARFFDEETQTNTLYELEGSSTVVSASWVRTTHSRNQLHLPLLTEEQLAALFLQHAPSLSIENRGDNDSIGAPRWQSGKISIDTQHAIVYSLPSLTRFEGRNLLQLNYVFWYPRRGARNFVDLYAGEIDSIIWRVTLDEEGQVLLYDSIHSCGCYHKYFLVADELRAKAVASSAEPANIFSLDGTELGDGVMLEITSNEHYIVGVKPKAIGANTIKTDARRGYRLAPYSQLQNLEHESGTRSLFDSHGIIPGSERLERYTLWPTGILSVGAMRQWGTHATGFIEQQQFDDADLFEHYFETIP